MSQDQQPIKLIGSLIDSNFRVIDPTAVTPSNLPPGTIIDVPDYLNPANPNLQADYIGMYNLANGNIALVNQFMGSYNRYGNGLPGDIRDFAAQYVDFLIAQGQIVNDPTVIKSSIKAVLDGFALAFQEATSFSNSLPEAQTIRDLFPNLTTYGFGNTDDPDQMAMVNAVWSNFVGHYTFQQDGSIASSSTTPSQGFFQNLRVFTAVTATITEAHTVSVGNGTGGSVTATTNKTPSFETVFYQYFPGLTPPDPLFDEKVQQFARGMIGTYGYFSPSRQYTNWVSYVQNISNTVAPAIATLPVKDVRILNDVFFLIVSMITSIQNIAASQAERLTLYTSWQKGYTDLLNQVHVFTGSSQDKLRDENYGPFSNSVSQEDVRKKRQDEQGNFNAGMVQQITAYKDTVSEDAKALQSRVNQSSDAFNEQANTATAILQQISTILSAIFR